MILISKSSRVLSVTPKMGIQAEKPCTFGYGGRVLSVTGPCTFGYGTVYFRLRLRVLSVTDSCTFGYGFRENIRHNPLTPL